MSATSEISTILILGGTTGIGLAFARRFHAMGKNIIITGRCPSRFATLATELPGLQTYTLDFNDLASLPAAAASIFAQWPGIDAVWINAGIQYASDIKDPKSTTDARVIEEINVNVTAPMLFARHAVPCLQALGDTGKRATLMLTFSGLGFVPVGSLFPVYRAAKAAIHAFAVGLRQALKGTNVSVVEIVPPYVGDTALGLEHRDLVKTLTPTPLEEFTDDVFGVLDWKNAAELKEVAAGSATPRVEAWRAGIGRILEQGLGGWALAHTTSFSESQFGGGGT